MIINHTYIVLSLNQALELLFIPLDFNRPLWDTCAQLTSVKDGTLIQLIELWPAFQVETPK